MAGYLVNHDPERIPEGPVIVQTQGHVGGVLSADYLNEQEALRSKEFNKRRASLAKLDKNYIVRRKRIMEGGDF